MSFELPAFNRAIENKDTLVTDLQRIVGESDELLNEIADATSEEFVTTRTKIEAKLRDARARIDEARIVAADRLSSAAEASTQYVRENPWKVVGAASLLGLGAALLCYRRVGR